MFLAIKLNSFHKFEMPTKRKRWSKGTENWVKGKTFEIKFLGNVNVDSISLLVQYVHSFEMLLFVIREVYWLPGDVGTSNPGMDADGDIKRQTPDLQQKSYLVEGYWALKVMEN